ncbi:PD-(D/E)XK nuclease family protein [Candidatus Peregrinibacteria bacterium]|nr:MAG: PD-(D/E)XK nuclease family protein [Candidatus Peregrinibacteria bacterium]
MSEILTQFYSHFKENTEQVRFLEKGFKLKIGDFTLTGRIDRADDLPDGTLEIIDYKTGKSRKQKDVEEDMQLFIYAMAAHECFGLTASRLTLYFLDDDVKLSTEPSSEKIDQVRLKLIDMAHAVNQSDFAPTPSEFTCSFCPFNKVCDQSAV